MRIAYIAAPWLPVPPPAYGGSETVIDRLARGAAAAGHEVMLFTTGDSNCPVERKWVQPTAVPDQMGASAIELAHVIGAYEAVREWGADIVHDHTVLGPAYARSLDGPPRVTTNHGPFDEAAIRIYNDVAPHTAIIAISHSQAAAARAVPITRVIHHGVDPTQYPVGDGQGGFLLFLGRMCSDKGVREAALVARASGVRLLIAAKMRDVTEREYFAAQVEPLLDDRVQFIGEITRRRKVELLGSATALLNPISWPEPFGLNMIEALACGTPVITYSCGAAPEIVCDAETGFVCRDRAEMIDRISDVAGLDRRRCRCAVEGHFSARRMVADHLDLYQWLVDGGASAARATSGIMVAQSDQITTWTRSAAVGLRHQAVR
jgi:glycosyltransferase involved in cell wall biosynthesis